MSESRVIIHYHIFKNAGTSVDAILHSSFGDDWSRFEGSHAHDVKNSEDLRRYLEQNPRIKAISTHLGRPPLPHPHCLPIVFVRHPILRVRSVYEYARKSPEQVSHSIAKRESLPGYVRWALTSDDGGVVMRNYQVIHLSDASFRNGSILTAEATPADLSQACALLARWGAVGLVEHYEESAAFFQRLYGGLVPQLNFQSKWLNRTTAEAKRAPAEQLQDMYQELGPTLYASLIACNNFDLCLYEFSQRLFESVNQRTG